MFFPPDFEVGLAFGLNLFQKHLYTPYTDTAEGQINIISQIFCPTVPMVSVRSKCEHLLPSKKRSFTTVADPHFYCQICVIYSPIESAETVYIKVSIHKQ